MEIPFISSKLPISYSLSQGNFLSYGGLFCKIILNFENEYQAQEVFNKFTENVNHNTLCMHFSCFTQWNNLCVISIFNELSKVPPYTENVFSAMRKSFSPPNLYALFDIRKKSLWLIYVCLAPNTVNIFLMQTIA